MMITLKLAEPLARSVGVKTISVGLSAAATLSEVLAEADRLHPAFGTALARGDEDVPYTLFVNDKLVHWEQAAQTQVRDGDKVFVMMPVAGGSPGP